MRKVAVMAALMSAVVAAWPAGAEAHCWRYSNRARLVTRFGHAYLFSTTMTTTWCGSRGHVTRLARVSVQPSLSTFGSLSNWDYKGVVARENRRFKLLRRRSAGYQVKRIVHWKQTWPTREFHYYVELNSFLYWDGHADHFNRVRNG